MITKTIFFPTNQNGKLACQAMVHIDLAPSSGIPASKVENTLIEIKTADNSFPPTYWKLSCLLRLELHQLTDYMTIPSHGLEAFEFQKQLLSSNMNLKTTSPVAVYYYRKEIKS